MRGRATRHFFLLGLLAVAGVCLCIAVIDNTLRFHPKKWLAQHEQAAEQYAGASMRGETPSLPASLSAYKVESGADWVSFGMLIGPFYSHGMLYSPAGHRRGQGLGGEPEIKKWERVKENWYYWVAD